MQATGVKSPGSQIRLWFKNPENSPTWLQVGIGISREEECAAFDALKTRIAAASGAIDRETTLIAEEAQSAIAI
jgi:hypothetical protein